MRMGKAISFSFKSELVPKGFLLYTPRPQELVMVAKTLRP